MKSTIIKSHGRTGEGISAPVRYGDPRIGLSNGPASIRKATNRSAWPLKFLPKPLECCHVAHSSRPHGFCKVHPGGNGGMLIDQPHNVLWLIGNRREANPVVTAIVVQVVQLALSDATFGMIVASPEITVILHGKIPSRIAGRDLPGTAFASVFLAGRLDVAMREELSHSTLLQNNIDRLHRHREHERQQSGGSAFPTEVTAADHGALIIGQVADRARGFAANGQHSIAAGQQFLRGGGAGHLGLHTRLERAHRLGEGRLGGEDGAEARRNAASSVIELQFYATAPFAALRPLVESRFTDDCNTTDTSLWRASCPAMKAEPHMGAADPFFDHKNRQIASFPDMRAHADTCLGARAGGVSDATRAGRSSDERYSMQ